MENFIDLHTHSTASDGTLSPAELINQAKEIGLRALALTDHDTTDGLEEAAHAAKEVGIELVPGIEISADYNGEMHLLGLLIDPGNPDLQAALSEMKRFRAIRNLEMIRRLQALGYAVTSEEVCALKPGGKPDNIGRIHMARLLVQKGYFPDVRDVFDSCLGTGCPASVSYTHLFPSAISGLPGSSCRRCRLRWASKNASKRKKSAFTQPLGHGSKPPCVSHYFQSQLRNIR